MLTATSKRGRNWSQLLLSKTHAVKGDLCKGGKNSKLRITVFLCGNMDDSDKCLVFVIVKSKSQRCCKNPGAVPPQLEGVDDAGSAAHGAAEEEGGICFRQP